MADKSYPAPHSTAPHSIRVVAGALFDSDGQVLIAQRRPGSQLAGRWEFPGGKLNPGETEIQALARELAEELGVVLVRAEHMLELTHDYPERRIELSMWHVTEYRGEPRSLEAQALKWVRPADLAHEDLLEADQPIVQFLIADSPRRTS